jgi:hypothetical protein
MGISFLDPFGRRPVTATPEPHKWSGPRPWLILSMSRFNTSLGNVVAHPIRFLLHRHKRKSFLLRKDRDVGQSPLHIRQLLFQRSVVLCFLAEATL